MRETASAPDPIPAAFQTDIEKLSPDVKAVMMATQVPYCIQAQLAKYGYPTLANLADRWTNQEKSGSWLPLT